MQKQLPISDDLFYWLQIAEGLSTDQIIELVDLGVVKELEVACTAIASVLARRCPSPNSSNLN